jgi:murein DD-endopeptidase MepM/ murein hydrolase activator NlpD
MPKSGRNLLLVVAAVGALGWYVNQDTAAGAPAHATYARPVAGVVSSGFGPRQDDFHYGLDIAAPLGTPIRAVATGTVIVAGPASGFGYWMQVRHDVDGTVTVYGHMRTFVRSAGDRVTAGQTIARVGAEGEATGPHLHIEVWPRGQRAARIDPLPWLASRGVRY